MKTFFSIPSGWTLEYTEQVERNIGFISVEDQEKLRQTRIAILGVGGIGAPIALQLAYSGCENFVLADKDIVDRSNLNRQPYRIDDIGQLKVVKLAQQLREINPMIQIRIFTEVTPSNVKDILKDVDIIALTLDGALGTLAVVRTARENKIPLIETWAIPYLFSWWFTSETLDYESVYCLPTIEMSLEQIQSSSKTLELVKTGILTKLLTFPGIRERYDHQPQAVEKLLRGEIALRSFSSVVWLNASYCAWELVFAGILKQIPKIYAPTIQGFDYYHQNLLRL